MTVKAIIGYYQNDKYYFSTVDSGGTVVGTGMILYYHYYDFDQLKSIIDNGNIIEVNTNRLRIKYRDHSDVELRCASSIQQLFNIARTLGCQYLYVGRETTQHQTSYRAYKCF